ncbi:uncharacterized protein LOC120842735 [Ixodes scapularis]|uniref:uncharacterized protein LOC120842735 n=1 Tax=Ixodes scapularis TaxID=6945 RepID=UPI00116182E2|nr:uncharacterized protein LOC120842735 [Ixodes scapularis]
MKLMPCSFLLCFLAILVDAKPGEILLDEEDNYWQYQDMQKFLNNPDRESWLYYRTYTTEHTCVYVKVNENQPNGSDYEFVQEYRLGTQEHNTKQTATLYATPYKTKMYATERQNNNAMRISPHKDATSGKRFQLIYTDSDKCDILRVLDVNNGRACELYLHNNAVDAGVPENCKKIYGNACGKGDSSYTQQVYHPWCKKNVKAQ